MTHDMVRGLVLAGGKSSRMGEDKSLISYHGKPQREYLFSLLRNFCQGVHLSCKSNETIPARLNPIVDQYELDSPLNGILSAFQLYPDTAWISVPTDMPLVNEETIRFMIEHRDPSKIATCFFDSDGKFPEPLLTVWEPHAYSLLMKFFQEGNYSPRQFLKENDINLLKVPDKRMLTNINSQEDLEVFRKKRD